MDPPERSQSSRGVPYVWCALVFIADERFPASLPALRLRCAAWMCCALLLPALAEAQYVQRFSATTNGAVTFTGNTLGLDGEVNQNGQGTRGPIGTFITTDTSLRDDTPLPTTAPLFPFGTT